MESTISCQHGQQTQPRVCLPRYFSRSFRVPGAGGKALSQRDIDLGKIGTINLAWPLVEEVLARESTPNSQAAHGLLKYDKPPLGR